MVIGKSVTFETNGPFEISKINSSKMMNVILLIITTIYYNKGTQLFFSCPIEFV